MLNAAYYKRNANQNYSEVPPHIDQNGHLKSLQIANAGEGGGEKGIFLHC